MLTGRVAVGPHVEELRCALEAMYAPSIVLPVNAGRTALRLALRTFSAKRPGRRRVLMPAYLCPSAVNVVRELGLQPYPVGVGADLNLNPDQLVFDDGVLAVLAAHMYACPARIGDIERRCREAGVLLIDDAAQVVGVRSDGRLLGTFGDVGVLSFAQSKTLVTGIRGSGGMLLINNPGFQEELRQAHATLSPPDNRLASLALFLTGYLLATHLGGAGYYASRIAHALLPTEGKDPYLPALMGNLEAGIARAQLARLPEVLAARTRVAKLYAAALRDLPAVTMPQYAPGRFLSRLFVEVSDTATAPLIRCALQARKISTRAAYPSWTDNTEAACSNNRADHLVEVPSRSQMTETDVAQVALSLQQVLGLHTVRMA